MYVYASPQNAGQNHNWFILILSSQLRLVVVVVVVNFKEGHHGVFRLRI
jgi:hypothetical protein